MSTRHCALATLFAAQRALHICGAISQRAQCIVVFAYLSILGCVRSCYSGQPVADMISMIASSEVA
jgi:hypothetical protein